METLVLAFVVFPLIAAVVVGGMVELSANKPVKHSYTQRKQGRE